MKKLISDILKKNKKRFIWLLMLNIAVAVTGSVSIVMLVPMLDLLEISVGDSGTLQNLLTPFARLPYVYRAGIIISIFVLLVLVKAFLSRSATLRQTKFLEDYELDLRRELYDSISASDWEKLSAIKSSELVNLMVTQCRQARFCLQGIINLFASCASAVTQLIIACFMSLSVTAVVLLVGVAFLWMFRPFQKRSRAYGEQAVEINRNLYREIQEQLLGLKEIRAYGAEKVHNERFSDLSQQSYNTNLKQAQLSVLPQLCYAIAAAVMVALAFVYGVLILRTGTAQLIVLVYIFSHLWPIFSSWQGQLQNISAFLPAWETLKKTVEMLDNTDTHRSDTDTAITFDKELRFDNVSFMYRNGNKEVLTDVSFTIPYGSITALIGRSGAGKSTAADLLMGLLRPRSGQILVDGTPLSEENAHSWHKLVGYVPQDPLLFNGTIRENLLRFHPEATEEDIIVALKQAIAWDFVSALPKGLDTVIGSRGLGLSGGQRQRIVLARVLLGKPRLIILDEATSALDYESEGHIRETIMAQRGKTTILVIAHRLATIRSADSAIVLEDGKVVENGPMSELLMKEDGYMTKMVSIE